MESTNERKSSGVAKAGLTLGIIGTGLAGLLAAFEILYIPSLVKLLRSVPAAKLLECCIYDDGFKFPVW